MTFTSLKRVTLLVPQDKQHHCKHPKTSGEHFAYHGRVGDIIAWVGNGAWVHFDGTEPAQYVGCPIEWLEAA